MKDDKQDTEETSPHAHLQKFAGIGDNGGGEQKRFRRLDESFTEGDIFQDRLIWKAAELLEQRSSDEQRLITIDDATAGATEVIEKGNKFEPPIIP